MEVDFVGFRCCDPDPESVLPIEILGPERVLVFQQDIYSVPMDFGEPDQSMAALMPAAGMQPAPTQQPMMEPYGGAPAPTQIPQNQVAPVPVQYPTDPNAPYAQPPVMAPPQ